ncbi:MAG: HD domain-containing phosphohydrolase [Bacillota bacterium]
MKRHRILIADDDEKNRRLLGISLSGGEYDLVFAADGREALDRVAEARPDLILLDVLMPRLDGFELCRMLKGDEDTRGIPVLMVTSLGNREDRIKGLKSGADDFLTKPLDIVELQARVKSLLRTKDYHYRIEESYRSILNITDYSEVILKGFDPLNFDVRAEDEIIMNFLRRSDEEYDRPAIILVCSHGDTSAKCVLYGSAMNSGGMRKVHLYIPVEELRVFTERNIFNAGDGTAAAADSPGFHPDIERAVGKINNYVSYAAGGQLLAAINYLKRVNRFDVQVIKSLAVNKKFLHTVARLTRELEDSFLYTIGALARAAEANDEDTGDHIVRVNEYSRALAVELSLPDQLVEVIGYSAQMHDVGKIHIHPDILRKTGPLSPEETAVMQLHTVYGRNILGDSPRLAVAAGIALAHHESWDGSGYPYGLKGEEIFLPARIVQLADVYDALRSRRVYKKAYSHEEAVRTILNGDGRTRPDQFDPAVLQAFIRKEALFREIFDKYPDELKRNM